MLSQNLMHPGDRVSVCRVKKCDSTYLAELKEGSPEISTRVRPDVVLQVLLVFYNIKIKDIR